MPLTIQSGTACFKKLAHNGVPATGGNSWLRPLSLLATMSYFQKSSLSCIIITYLILNSILAPHSFLVAFLFIKKVSSKRVDGLVTITIIILLLNAFHVLGLCSYLLLVMNWEVDSIISHLRDDKTKNQILILTSCQRLPKVSSRYRI